jgi:hypothetical protein
MHGKRRAVARLFGVSIIRISISGVISGTFDGDGWVRVVCGGMADLEGQVEVDEWVVLQALFQSRRREFLITS